MSRGTVYPQVTTTWPRKKVLPTPGAFTAPLTPMSVPCFCVTVLMSSFFVSFLECWPPQGWTFMGLA